MKIYRHGDTYIAPRGSFFDGNVKIDGNFIAPRTRTSGAISSLPAASSLDHTRQLVATLRQKESSSDTMSG